MGRGIVVVEWTFAAEHKGPFAGYAATDARIEVPGCGVHEYDAVKRQITAARIYFDSTTLLRQLLDQHNPRTGLDQSGGPSSPGLNRQVSARI